MEKFKRHIGRPIEFKLDKEDGTSDVFQLKPLSVELFTEFMLISEELNKKGGEMNPATIKDLFDLYVKILINSYPDLDQETAEGFMLNNFVELVDVFNKLMPTKVSDQQKKAIKEKLELMKKNES